MRKRKPTYEVFIAHSQRDIAIAREVRDFMHSHELSVFLDIDEIVPGDVSERTIREALAECHAVIFIIPEDDVPAWLAFELGAAKAWNKPIYAVAAKPGQSQLPLDIQGIKVYPKSRIEEIAKQIARRRDLLTREERLALVKAYLSTGVPTDRLLLNPHLRAQLVQSFKKLAGREMEAEHLLSWLIRLRKRGKLPSLSKQKRGKFSLYSKRKGGKLSSLSKPAKKNRTA
jgi:hypothetical protein